MSTGKLDYAQLKEFLKRNIEGHITQREERLQVLDAHFNKDIKEKPEIGERSRRLARDMSAENAERFHVRPWIRNPSQT
jgi:hypothetical protein